MHGINIRPLHCNQEKNDVILYSCLSGIVVPMWEMNEQGLSKYLLKLTYDLRFPCKVLPPNYVKLILAKYFLD